MRTYINRLWLNLDMAVWLAMSAFIVSFILTVDGLYRIFQPGYVGHNIIIDVLTLSGGVSFLPFLIISILWAAFYFPTMIGYSKIALGSKYSEIAFTRTRFIALTLMAFVILLISISTNWLSVYGLIGYESTNTLDYEAHRDTYIKRIEEKRRVVQQARDLWREAASQSARAAIYETQGNGPQIEAIATSPIVKQYLEKLGNSDFGATSCQTKCKAWQVHAQQAKETSDVVSEFLVRFDTFRTSSEVAQNTSLRNIEDAPNIRRQTNEEIAELESHRGYIFISEALHLGHISDGESTNDFEIPHFDFELSVNEDEGSLAFLEGSYQNLMSVLGIQGDREDTPSILYIACVFVVVIDVFGFIMAREFLRNKSRNAYVIRTIENMEKHHSMNRDDLVKFLNLIVAAGQIIDFDKLQGAHKSGVEGNTTNPQLEFLMELKYVGLIRKAGFFFQKGRDWKIDMLHAQRLLQA